MLNQNLQKPFTTLAELVRPDWGALSPVKLFSAYVKRCADGEICQVSSNFISSSNATKIRSHLMHFISEKISNQSTFDLETGSIRSAIKSNWSIPLLIAKGYDGLLYIKNGEVKSHVLYRRKGDVLHTFSLWNADGDTLALRTLISSFIRFARHETKASELHIGTNEPRIKAFMSALNKYQHKFEVLALESGRILLKSYIDNSASVDPKSTSHLKHPFFIGKGSVIGPNVKLGERTQVGTGAVLTGNIEIGDDNIIGSHAVLDGDIRIGSGNKIGHHTSLTGKINLNNKNNLAEFSSITGETTIGSSNHIATRVDLGGRAQDAKDKNGLGSLLIGDGNSFAERVVIHRGSLGGKTSIGNSNYFMVDSHLGHDVSIANNCSLINGVNVAGHCRIDSNVTISARALIHQWVNIGLGAFIESDSKVENSVAPGMIASNRGLERARIVCPNKVGLHRLGLSESQIDAWQSLAHKSLFKGESIDSIDLSQIDPVLMTLVKFIKEQHPRGLCLGKKS